MRVIDTILTSFRRNHKILTIGSSGSTCDAAYDRIRSGQSYLYQLNGMESEVMEISFHKKVRGGILNQALLNTIKRYPYLNTRLVELDGDFYIVQNERQLTARKTKTLARLGHVSCGYHLVDVTYHDCTVYISWHHALCDGKGIKPFVETLIYYYCKLRYRSSASSDGIRLHNSPLLYEEIVEPNLCRYSYDDSKQFVDVSRDAYAIPENVQTVHDVDYRYEVIIPAEPFMHTCRSNHATPVILTSLLMSRGIAGLYPDFDKPINANIAVDIRDALDIPNTFKNCVRSMPLPFPCEFLSLSFGEQVKIQRELLNAQRDRDYCRKLANASLDLFEKLDVLPTYHEKQKMMGFFNGMLLNTYVISYLGQMVLNENAQYVEKIGFYNSGSVGLGITMVSCGDVFCLNFKQSFESDKYVREFCNGLQKLGISYTLSSSIPFLTPKDALINRQ